jgi:hypothetical protein
MFQGVLDFCRRLMGRDPFPTASVGEAERRVWVRHPSSAHTSVRPMSNGISNRLSARIANVSRGGIGLIVNQPLRLGDMVSVELPHPPGEAAETVLACVVHVTEAGPGEWSLGCTFSEPLDGRCVRAFGNEGKPETSAEQRGWIRYDCALKAECQIASDPEKKIYPVEVVNISAGGIGLQVHQPVEAGTLLSLKLASTNSHQERTILACVVHVVPREGTWQLGCNFIRELNEADLEALV